MTGRDVKNMVRERNDMSNKEMLELVKYISGLASFALIDNDPEKCSIHDVIALLYYLEDRLERMIEKDDRRK